MKIHYPGDRLAHRRSLCKLPHIPSSRLTGDTTGVTCLRCRAILDHRKDIANG